MTKYWQIIKSFCKTKLHVKKSLTNLLNSLKSRTEIDKNTCLCQSFGFYDVKKEYYLSKRKGKYFYTFNHFYSEKSSKDQNSTNHLLWTLICRHKPAIIPKWINSLETNFLHVTYLSLPADPTWSLWPWISLESKAFMAVWISAMDKVSANANLENQRHEN